MPEDDYNEIPWPTEPILSECCYCGDTFPDVVDELRVALGGVAEDQDVEKGGR